MAIINEPGGLLPQKAVPKLRAAINMAEQYAKQMQTPGNGTTPPPVRFGKVTTAFSDGDATVEIEMVRFDDTSTSVSAGRTFLIYVYWHELAWGVEAYLGSGAIVPFIPFQGEDEAGVSGILAGHLLRPDLTSFAARFVMDGATPSIEFNDGEVYYGASNPTTVSDGAAKFSLAVDKWFWVEITVTGADGGSTPSVNSSLQSNAAKPSEWVASGGNLTIKWIIGQILTGSWYQKWYGDVHLLFPEMPNFHDDVEGAVPNAVLVPAYQEHTNSGDALDSYFFKGRETEIEVEGGGWRSVTDQTNPMKFGGRDLDSTQDRVESLTLTTANQIAFNRKQWDFNLKSGLMQTLTDLATSGYLVKALKWIGVEVGGQLVHNISPVDSTSHVDHWFKLTINITGGIVVDDGTAADTIDLYFDRTGHLWKYDTTEQPPPSSNYRYRHCSDPITYPDLIFASQQANTTIEVLGECYLEVDTTDEDATSPAPTVNATYASCSACTTTATNEQWLKCSDNSAAAILSPGTTAVDYAWLCLSSVWVKCYNGYLTSSTATDPSVLEQCDNAAPTACTDLVGWPASDNFGGTGCNSGAVADTNWDIKWAQDNTDGTTSFAGGAVVMTAPANAVFKLTDMRSLKGDYGSGNFTLTLDYNLSSLPSNGGAETGVSFHCYVNGSLYYIQRVYSSAGGGHLVRWNGGSSSVGSGDLLSGTFKIERVGTTLKTYIGVTEYSSHTVSNNLTTVWHNVSQTGGSVDTVSSFDNFTFVDGSSNPVIIDPTGGACT